VELLIFYDAVKEAIKIFILFYFYIYADENIKVKLLM